MRVVFRGKQSVALGALLIGGTLFGGMLTSAGCGSKTKDNAPDPSITQKTGTGQEGNTAGKTRAMQAPLPAGATGTPSDTFVKPGQ